MRAIILAGGFGTRLRPLTLHTPKPMLPINGTPILEHHVRALVGAGIKDIVISTGYLDQVIRDHFGDGSTFDAKITYSHEEQPLGTGGAVKQANAGNQEQFILIWGDNVHDVDYAALLQAHTKQALQRQITMALTQREDVEHFGAAILEDDRIVGFIEKPPREQAPSKWINAGVFVIDPQVLKRLPAGSSSIEKACFEPSAAEVGMNPYFHKRQWYPTDTKEKYELAQEFRAEAHPAQEQSMSQYKRQR